MAQSDNRERGASGSRSPITERLLHSAEDYLGARSEKLAGTLGNKVSSATQQLTNVASGDAQPGSLLGRTAKNVAQGESPGKAMLKGTAGGVVDKVKGLFGGKGGGSNKKLVNIEESVDVGVPVRQAYN